MQLDGNTKDKLKADVANELAIAAIEGSLEDYPDVLEK
jgi:hypothetical protein